MHIAPKGGDSVKIFLPGVVNEIVAFTASDDDRIFRQPFLHLCEGVPQIRMVPGLQVSVRRGHERTPNSFPAAAKASRAWVSCSRVCVAIGVTRRREEPWGTV